MGLFYPYSLFFLPDRLITIAPKEKTGFTFDAISFKGGNSQFLPLKLAVLTVETRSFNKENCQYPLVQLLVPYGMLFVFMRYMPYIPILFATCSALR